MIRMTPITKKRNLPRSCVGALLPLARAECDVESDEGESSFLRLRGPFRPLGLQTNRTFIESDATVGVETNGLCLAPRRVTSVNLLSLLLLYQWR